MSAQERVKTRKELEKVVQVQLYEKCEKGHSHERLPCGSITSRYCAVCRVDHPVEVGEIWVEPVPGNSWFSQREYALYQSLWGIKFNITDLGS